MIITISKEPVTIELTANGYKGEPFSYRVCYVIPIFVEYAGKWADQCCAATRQGEVCSFRSVGLDSLCQRHSDENREDGGGTLFHEDQCVPASHDWVYGVVGRDSIRECTICHTTERAG